MRLVIHATKNEPHGIFVALFVRLRQTLSKMLGIIRVTLRVARAAISGRQELSASIIYSDACSVKHDGMNNATMFNSASFEDAIGASFL